MGKLIYAAIASLDGYIADADGRFDWSMPDEEVHAFVNDQQRALGTHLYGRRLYDVMLAWETMETAGEPQVVADFAAVWRDADKIVYSRTLQQPSSARTRIEREFDVEAVRALKASAERDIGIGGAELAGQAIAAGLVDELQLLLSPIVVGGGTPALPAGVRWPLELVAERRFANGVVFLHHRAAG